MQKIEVYIKLHETVLNYKHGNLHLSESIISSFNEYLWRYVNLIKKGVFDLNDSSLRKFVALFTPNLKTVADEYYKKKSVREKLILNGKRITELFSSYTEEDIRGEMICILLDMARKYNDYTRPSFHTYVQRCFHFEAFRRLQTIIKDPLSRQEYVEFKDTVVCDKTIMELEYSIEEMDKKLAIQLYGGIEEKTNSFDIDMLNQNWINGITCSSNFRELTKFERTLIKEHSIQKETDNAISLKYGFCRATINRKRLSAQQKLKASFKIKT